MKTTVIMHVKLDEYSPFTMICINNKTIECKSMVL